MCKLTFELFIVAIRFFVCEWEKTLYWKIAYYEMNSGGLLGIKTSSRFQSLSLGLCLLGKHSRWQSLGEHIRPSQVPGDVCLFWQVVKAVSWNNWKPLASLSLYILECCNQEIKEDTNRWRNIPCSWIGRINTVKMGILPKAIFGYDSMQFLSNYQQYFSEN